MVKSCTWFATAVSVVEQLLPTFNRKDSLRSPFTLSVIHKLGSASLLLVETLRQQWKVPSHLSNSKAQTVASHVMFGVSLEVKPCVKVIIR